MTKESLICDVELYRDYLLIAFMNTATQNVKAFEMFPGHDLNRQSIRNIFDMYRIVTFNGINYDIPMISAALQGASNAKLKELSDKIIVNGIRHWNLGIDLIRCDHVDLFEVAPGMASLKIYGGRLHCPKLQDLPIDPAASISPEQREQLKSYNVNDLQTTLALYNHLKPQIELREQMSAVYGIDLRSKSDAQIAEAVISKQVGVALGETVKRPEVKADTRFNYVAPKFIKFATQPLRDLLAMVQRVEFLIPAGGNVQLPKELEKTAVRIGRGDYRLGIGGLHSSEKTISHYADDEYIIVDRDVTSYYPAIILNCGLAPAHMGAAFSRSYRDLVDQRIKAKRAGNKVGADSLKIVVNGSFGKFGSMWSKLYSPHLLIQTTLTGQLALLMLIERLEGIGVEVISANTDGVALKVPRDMQMLLSEEILGWEEDTSFDTEETAYRALHSRDVNNYIAIKPDGGVKLKGAYAPPGLQKNPTNEICVEAVIAFLKDRTSIEQTIDECEDLRKFVTIRQVKGGAIDQQGNYLGKAVRWYYAKGVEGPLRYKINGYTVARSEGAKPCMELPEVAEDIDDEWYVNECRAILADVGVDPVLYQIGDLI